MDKMTEPDDYERHQQTGEGYSYCGMTHEGVTDAEYREWCRVYHTPKLPKRVARLADVDKERSRRG